MFLILVLVLVLCILGSNVKAYGVIISTDENQNRLNVEVPSEAEGSVVSGNKPVPVFLAIDRVRTEEDDKINYILVCKNEGDQKGSNECVFQARDDDGIVEEEKCGEIDEPGSVVVCRGSFRVEKELYLTPYASDNSSKNYLVFKVPVDKKESGILVLFSESDLKKISSFDEAQNFHLLVKGESASKSYGNYTWILKNLVGVKDQEGNLIDKYPVNTKSFLKGEKIVVWNYEGSGSSPDLKNGGFEDGTSGWSLDDGNWSISNVSHGGQKSLHILTDENYDVFEAYQRVGVNPNTIIDVSEWIKTKDVEKRGDGNGVYLRARLVNPEGNVNVYTEKLDGTNNWKKFEMNVDTRAATYLYLYLYFHRSKGEAWFDDFSVEEVSNISEGEIVDVGKYDDTYYVLRDGRKLRIEPNLYIKYSEESMNKKIIIGKDFVVNQSMNVESKSSERSQPLNLTPNMSFSEGYKKNSCFLDQCFETVIFGPGENKSFNFSWKENGIKMEYLGIEQNKSATQSLDEQHLIQKIKIENPYSKTFENLEGAVFVDGICENWKESLREIDWNDYLKERCCYVYVDELKGGDSVTKEIGFYGDFLSANYGGLEQDPTKSSNLDEQFIRKKVEIRPKEREKKVSWNIPINVSMPGNCSDCQKNITKKVPVLHFDFKEGKGNIVKDVSGHGNNGEIYGAEWTENGLKFDGKDDYVDAGDDESFNMQDKDFTLSGMVKPLGDGALFGFSYCWRWTYGFTLTNGRLIAQLTNSSGTTTNYDTNYDLIEGEWNFIALTLDKNSKIMKIYVNGNLIKTFDVSSSLPLANNSQGCWYKFALGRHGAPKSFFNGTIGDVRIYDKVLSDDEILGIANGKNTVENNDVMNDYVHSRVDWLDYKLSDEEELRIEGNRKVVRKKLTVKNKGDVDFRNVSASVDVGDLGFEKEEVKCSGKVYDLKYEDGKISFVIPELNKGESKEFFVIYNRKMSTMEQITGNFLSNPSEYGLIVEIVFVVGVLSYIIRKKRRGR